MGVSLGPPEEEGDQVPVEVEGRELAAAEVGVAGTARETGWRTSASASSANSSSTSAATIRQLAVPAMNDSAPERTGRSATRAAPALVARLPEVKNGIVPRQDGEASVVVEHLEAEAVVVEGDRGGGVPNGERRDRLAQRHHRRSSL